MKMRLDNVSFGYGKTPLFTNVSAELAPGAVTVLAGPNGAGKSTLLRLLSAYLSPNSGTVWADDRPLGALSAAARSRTIGVLSQMPPPALGFTVRELVELSARPRLPRWGKLPEADEKQIMDAMKIFAVERFADIPANRLSGGELARVRLAGVAALSPEILLLDEPAAALDPAFRNQAMRWCEMYAETHAVLLITHDLELVGRARRVWLLGNGKFQSGEADTLLTAENLSALYGTPASVEVLKTGLRRIAFPLAQNCNMAKWSVY